jgi:hypothetical protein
MAHYDYDRRDTSLFLSETWVLQHRAAALADLVLHNEVRFTKSSYQTAEIDGHRQT